MPAKSAFSIIGLAHKVCLAAETQGYTPELLNALAESPTLFGQLLEVQLGRAEVKPFVQAVSAPSEAMNVKIYPADGEVFELTLDGDAPENQPLGMVRRDGYSDADQWRHNGQKVTGKQTRRFRLVSIGYCQSWLEVLRKLAEHGRIPEGQWRNAFKNAFSKPDGNLVGVADSSWVNSYSHASFPFVGSRGDSSLIWIVRDFDDDWRWLVEVVE